MRGELADDVSELPVGPIFTGQTDKDNQYPFSSDEWRWDPQGVPKRRQLTHLAYRAITQKQTNNIKVFSLHTMTAKWQKRYAPFIVNLGAGWRWEVNFTPQPL
jgi:hypothetical protein